MSFFKIKILLVSKLPPSLGGLETMGLLIGQEWASCPGTELKVVTDVKGSGDDSEMFEIFRQPNLQILHNLYKWADVIFFNHCYIRLSLPLLWTKKPFVLSMSGTIPKKSFATPIQKIKGWLLKKLMTSATANISACEYIREANGVNAHVITNPYNSHIYYPRESILRSKHFVFAGRINQYAKGCLDLIEALAICNQKTNSKYNLTVIGDGEDLETMKEKVLEMGLSDNVSFLGILRGSALADQMRLHQVIVVPSRYLEPIGIVCLEGIACGCIAVGSCGGGLGESVGPCGFTYPNGNVQALADAMLKAVSLKLEEKVEFSKKSEMHLRSYQPDTVTTKYLSVVREALKIKR